MPPAKPAAKDIKTQVSHLLAELPAGAPLAKIFSTLAGHDAVVRMLAQALPAASPDQLRRALARSASLVTNLEAWVAPPSKASASAPSDSSKETATAAPSDLSDPDAIGAHPRVKVYIDGASKGNPGPASAGVVITDMEGVVLYEEARYLGDRLTNNAAEYGGLIRALEILTQNGRPEAFFFADSLLVVNQMNLVWSVKHPAIKPLFTQAQLLKRRLPRFQILHVGREKNKRADQLANLAIKQAKDASFM